MPIDEIRALDAARQELAEVRLVLAAKMKRYHRLALVGIALGVVLSVLVGVGAYFGAEQRRTVNQINQRGKENKAILINLEKLVADVDSVTSAQARTDQTAATKVLVDGLVCRIEVALQHSDLSLPLPAGCVP